MNLKEMKTKTLALIEELNPNSEYLTDDPDIATKHNEVINQVMFEMARIRKIPRYLQMEVTEGTILQFADIEREVGNEIYQIIQFEGVAHEYRANGTVFKIKESGTAEIDCYVYPERITDKTKDNAYEFELPPDVLEIMPYGIAADLLKSDESANFGQIYASRYAEMKNEIDIRYMTATISVEGGYDV